MTYRYLICDVFTETRFGGNQLAVLPDAEGLGDREMQQIAREFNFSETTFVFASTEHTRAVRIFTPNIEVPFAGHPSVGTAFCLAETGELGDVGAGLAITFDEPAGVVPISVERRAGGIWSELTAPQELSIGPTVPVEALAAAVSLDPHDVVTTSHPPQVASVGLPFVMAELRDRTALERARVHLPHLEALRDHGITPDVHLYVRSLDDFDVRARMFAPLDGVPEDPATGSANCALVGLLAQLEPDDDLDLALRIAQGVEMGRPSVLEARAIKRDGAVEATRIGGSCALVADGHLHLDSPAATPTA